jgi:hypothetical protein
MGPIDALHPTVGIPHGPCEIFLCICVYFGRWALFFSDTPGTGGMHSAHPPGGAHCQLGLLGTWLGVFLKCHFRAHLPVSQVLQGSFQCLQEVYIAQNSLLWGVLWLTRTVVGMLRQLQKTPPLSRLNSIEIGTC